MDGHKLAIKRLDMMINFTETQRKITHEQSLKERFATKIETLEDVKHAIELDWLEYVEWGNDINGI